jgi:hypothetical protein
MSEDVKPFGVRALRKSETFHRKQEVFVAVKEQDDEFRAMKIMHRSLMKLTAGARRRVVRYIVERHLANEEPSPDPAAPPVVVRLPPPEGAPLSAEQSVAIAKAHVTATA